jgi:hypothetical protein
MLAEIPLLDKGGVRGWLIRVLDSVPTTPCPLLRRGGELVFVFIRRRGLFLLLLPKFLLFFCTLLLFFQPLLF